MKFRHGTYLGTYPALQIINSGYPLIWILDWCEENDCGDMDNENVIVFQDEAERTMFLLRWA